jgi:hypothetical protein
MFHKVAKAFFFAVSQTAQFVVYPYVVAKIVNISYLEAFWCFIATIVWICIVSLFMSEEEMKFLKGAEGHISQLLYTLFFAIAYAHIF